MKVKELEVEKASKIEQVQRWVAHNLLWNLWLYCHFHKIMLSSINKVSFLYSLQTAITASTESRKQVQEESQERQKNLINLQHDLSQVGL